MYFLHPLYLGCYYTYHRNNEVHSNSGIEIYYQTAVQETKSNMMLELFCQIVSEPCFNMLRTKEQLGMVELRFSMFYHSFKPLYKLCKKKN